MLRECLLNTPAVELIGMQLLKEHPRLMPNSTLIDRQQLIEAVTEIVSYTNRCVQARESLMQLAPIPLIDQTVTEYGL